MQALQDQGIEPEMPEIPWGRYLLDYLWDLGPSMPGPACNVGISPPWLESWEREQGIRLSPWESRLLRRVSAEYAGEAAQATAADRPPPFAESSDAQRLLQLEMDRKMDAFLN